jgi:glutaredoxin-related protein
VPSQVVVYTAPGCHLCAPALETVRAVCGDNFDVVDISTDTALERQYRHRIPLVEIDGVERFRYDVDEEALRELF